MIYEASRVVFEVQSEDQDQALARLLRAVAKYDCAILDGIGTTFFVRINLSHVRGFDRDASPVSMKYRSPVRLSFGRLVPLFSGPEEEVMSHEGSNPGSN